jgi:hypothetical protein
LAEYAIFLPGVNRENRLSPFFGRRRRRRMDEKKYYRTIDQVIDEDFLWPSSQLKKGCSDPEENIRYRAIEEVLCRIPNEDYEKLKPKIDEFQWFVPDKEILGVINAFFWMLRLLKTKKEKSFLPLMPRFFI